MWPPGPEGSSLRHCTVESHCIFCSIRTFASIDEDYMPQKNISLKTLTPSWVKMSCFLKSFGIVFSNGEYFSKRFYRTIQGELSC